MYLSLICNISQRPGIPKTIFLSFKLANVLLKNNAVALSELKLTMSRKIDFPEKLMQVPNNEMVDPLSQETTSGKQMQKADIPKCIDSRPKGVIGWPFIV